VKTLSLTQAKSKLGSLVDRAHALGKEVMITRNGRPAAVLVSVAKFESWTKKIASGEDASFLKEIRTGLAALKAGRAKLYTLDELLR
jgi:prevent-host-death family protein